MKLVSCTLATAALVTGLSAGASAEGLERCLKAAQEIRSGRIIKVEYLVLVNQGQPSYEIEIRDAQGQEWELMCEADDDYISEIEREVGSATAPEFRKRAKVSEQAATGTAKEAWPGSVTEIEYEIEANGNPSYEIDIRALDGKEVKLEVDAVSGEIIEVSVESWQIGYEPAEKH